MPRLRRRDFLKNASGMLAGSWLIRTTGSLAKTDELIKVGVITEPSGSHLGSYLKSLAGCQGIEQIALADETGETFGQARSILGGRFAKLRTFREYHEMIKVIKPDMALVTLQAHRMPSAIRIALEGNCHVLAEKHPCVRIEDFEPLVRTAESKQRHLILAFANRFSPLVKKAKELVQSGLLGKLFGTDVYLIADQTRLKNPEYQQSWRALKDKAGGGHLVALGIHYLDLVQFITNDKVRQVCGFSQNVGGQPIEVEDAAVAALQFENGMVGTLHSGYYLDHSYHTQIVIWGSQGWLRFNLIEKTPLRWYSSAAGSPTQVQSFSDTTDFLSNQYLPLVQAAVNAARGIEQPPLNGAEGLQVLKAVFGFYSAAKTGSTQIIS